MNPRITWNSNPASEQVLRYEVYRAVPGGSLSKIADVTDGSNSFDDLSAAQGTSYNYVVKAVNWSASSANSAPASTPSTPSAPTGVTVTIVA